MSFYSTEEEETATKLCYYLKLFTKQTYFNKKSSSSSSFSSSSLTQTPRSVHGSTKGLVYGIFRINENLNEKFKIGLFSGEEEDFDCLIRFTGAKSLFGSQGSDLSSDVYGVSIKTNKGDFVLNSSSSFPVEPNDLIQLFYCLTRKWKYFILFFWFIYLIFTGKIVRWFELYQTLYVSNSLLYETYYSFYTHRFGNRIVKYRLIPLAYRPPSIEKRNTNSKTFLTEELYKSISQQYINKGDKSVLRFSFEIQFQDDTHSNDVWNPLATLIIPDCAERRLNISVTL